MASKRKYNPNKRTKQTQFITDEEWDWLKEHGKAKNFTMKEMVIIKKPVINKEILMPEIQTKKNKK